MGPLNPAGTLNALRKKHEADMMNMRSEMEDAMRAKDDAWP
jgi:hypothetical protein